MASASAQGPPGMLHGTVDNCLGSPVVDTSTPTSLHKSATGQRIQLITDPGASKTTTVSPSASADAIPGFAGCSVDYSANLYEVRLNPVGATFKDTDWNILVGQGCAPTLTTSAPNATFSNWQWTIPGTTFLSWVVSADQTTATLNPVPPPTLMTASPTVHWSEADTTETLSVSAQIMIGTQTFPISTTEKVKVVTPVSTFMIDVGKPYLNTINNVPFIRARDVMFGGGQVGSLWTGTVNKNPIFAAQGSASWQFVQLLTPSRSFEDSTGAFHTWIKTEGLDKSYPYPSSGPWSDDGMPYSTSDSPGMPLLWNGTGFGGADMNSISLRDKYKVYLMYQPPGNGVGVEWVPLRTANWDWTVIKDRPLPPPVLPSRWSILNGQVVGSMSKIDSIQETKHPKWSDNWKLADVHW